MAQAVALFHAKKNGLWLKPKMPAMRGPKPKPKVADFKEESEGDEEMEGDKDEEDEEDVERSRSSDGGDSD